MRSGAGWVAGAVAVAAVLSGCAGRPAPARFTVHGTYTIYSRTGDEFSVNPDQDTCAGAGIARGITPGAPVVVTDADDHVLALAALGTGGVLFFKGNTAGVRTSCTFAFDVRDVPDGLRYYRLMIGGRHSDQLSRAEAHRAVALAFDPGSVP